MPNNSRSKLRETKSASGGKTLHRELIKQMLTLATSGFGFVAALAWNNLIQEFVSSYVKRWLPTDGKLISLFIYALIVTILAVLVTYQLSKLSNRLGAEEDN